MFDELDLDLQLLDWLFALEGVEYGAEPMRSSLKQTDSIPRSEGCWYSTFRCLQIKSRGTKASRMSAARELGSKPKTVQDVTVSVCHLCSDTLIELHETFMLVFVTNPFQKLSFLLLS